MVEIRDLKGLKKSIDAKDEISEIDPIVIILKAFGLDDTDRSASDDYHDFGVSIAS